jgi:hypothetical protein
VEAGLLLSFVKANISSRVMLSVSKRTCASSGASMRLRRKSLSKNWERTQLVAGKASQEACADHYKTATQELEVE